MGTIFEKIQQYRFTIVLVLLIIAALVTFTPSEIMHTILQSFTTVGAVIVYLFTYGEEHWTYAMKLLGEKSSELPGELDDDADSKEAGLHAVGGKSDDNSDEDGPSGENRVVAIPSDH